jgi:hypothetical protein
MLTNKNYCDYETCVALRELGYDGKRSNYCYIEKSKQQLEPEAGIFLKVFRGEKYTYVNAIHLYEAQKWLREEHNLHIEITYSPSCWTGKIYDFKERDYIKGFTFFESFEETLHTLIKEAVKILKEE